MSDMMDRNKSGGLFPNSSSVAARYCLNVVKHRLVTQLPSHSFVDMCHYERNSFSFFSFSFSSWGVHRRPVAWSHSKSVERRAAIVAEWQDDGGIVRRVPWVVAREKEMRSVKYLSPAEVPPSLLREVDEVKRSPTGGLKVLNEGFLILQRRGVEVG